MCVKRKDRSQYNVFSKSAKYHISDAIGEQFPTILFLLPSDIKVWFLSQDASDVKSVRRKSYGGFKRKFSKKAFENVCKKFYLLFFPTPNMTIFNLIKNAE